MSLNLFKRHWHPIAHLSEFPARGSFVKLRWYGDSEIVAWRDFNDEIMAFDNVCPHRGARMIAGNSGQRASLVCPYHGLAYHSGEIHTPFKCESTLQLSRIDVAWCGKWLFASIDAADKLHDQLGNDAFEFMSFAGEAVDMRVDAVANKWKCDWQITVENALEDLHVPMIHRNTLDALDITSEKIIPSARNLISVYEIGNQAKAEQLKGFAEHYFPGERSPAYVTVFLFPFSQLSTTSGLTFSLQNWFPEQVSSHRLFDRTSFYQRTYGAASKNRDAVTPFFRSAARINRQIFEEDRQLCERIATYKTGTLTEREQKIGTFRQSLLDAGLQDGL